MNNTEFKLASFDQLSTDELYQILRLRAAVFVLEQSCAYQDIDDADQRALHIYNKTDDSQIIAYARILTPDQCGRSHCSIGRVVVPENKRHLKLGKSLMRAAIHACIDSFPKYPIKISAQTYLTSFYQNLGFKNNGQFYLEDDIPHQKMIYTP